MPFQGTIYFINKEALLEAHTESTPQTQLNRFTNNQKYNQIVRIDDS